MTASNPRPDSSPFGASPSTPSRRLFGMVALFVIVGGSIVTALVMTRDLPGKPAANAHGDAAAGTSATPVTLDAQDARRIGVTFAAVESGPITAEIRSVGQVTYDETRASAISAKVDGWVEKLHVDFTGREVRPGEPLLDLYSPMLVTAQEELLLALRLTREVEQGTAEARRAAEEVLASARRRLQYWDIPAAEIERIERTGQTTRTVTLRATSGGIVVQKSVVNGQRIMAGETLFQLADLQAIWVDGQVFEHDLALVRTGQRVSVEVQAYPGEQWSGRVSYLYPFVDAATRTARIRVELPNAGLRLKPGMFATIHVASLLRERVLTIPRSAVLETGQRSLVFYRAASGALEPRGVVTGVANDDRIEIRSGLQAGDIVVASATFLIDAESNLKSAIGNMANMPGMDMPQAKPVPKKQDDSSMPGMKMDAPKKVPPDEDHSKHGVPDAASTRKNPVRPEE